VTAGEGLRREQNDYLFTAFCVSYRLSDLCHIEQPKGYGIGSGYVLGRIAGVSPDFKPSAECYPVNGSEFIE
jgi:hypothetical protein